MKEIKAWVWNPTNAIFKQKVSEKAIGHIFLCEYPELCELHAKGQCVMCDGNTGCPYGRRIRELGFSKRASKFSSWIREFEEKHKAVVGVKLEQPKKLSYVVDYVYLPIAHLGINGKINFVKGGGYMSFSELFINKADFTSDFITKEIINFIPHALLGGIIDNYQKKEVPKFITWLKELDKPLFEEVKMQFPNDERFKFISNIGRQAKLITLTPNIGTFNDIHGGTWVWDGEYITSTNSHASFCLVDTKFIEECKLKPKSDSFVKVTDNRQVNENTEFIN